MHSPDLRPVLADLLTTHGYAVHRDESLEGRSGTVYEVPILAEGTSTLLIEFKDSPDPVEATDLDYLRNLLEDSGADQAVLVHQGPASYHLDRHEGVTLWGPIALRTALGDAFLHEQTGMPLAPLPLGAATKIERTSFPASAPMATPSPFKSPATVMEEENPFSLDSLGAAIEEAAPVPEIAVANDFTDMLPTFTAKTDDTFSGLDFDSLESMNAPVPPAMPQTVAGDSIPVRGIGPSTLRPRIPIHEARAMVKSRFSTIDRETLTLWPVHIVDYECDLLIDGTLKQDTVRGRIQVRGDKKGTHEVSTDEVDVAAIGTIDWTGPVDDHQFRRESDTAINDARILVMESHTKTVDMEVDDDDSDFTMMERKTVAPQGDLIRLEHLAATYRPAWKFESANGYILIDALTGQTIDEQLRTRHGETIIVD